MERESILKRIVFVAIILYVLDIILLGGGSLTKIGGVSTRMIFFAIAILASVPGLLKDFKKYIRNKYCISVGIFMVLVAVSLVLGIFNGNSRAIMMTDVKGFLNILIIFPMVYALDTKEKMESLVKFMLGALIGIAIVAVALSFYMQMPAGVQTKIYQFFNANVLCGITSLNKNVTRVFFHTAGRLFFAGFMFLLAFIIIKPGKKMIKEAGMALFICACFISYTRSIYMGIFVSFITFLVLVALLFRDKAKQYFVSILRMSIMTLVFVLLLAIVQKDNLISVAVNRCLLAAIETEDPMYVAEEDWMIENEIHNSIEDSDLSVEGTFDNIQAEKGNLEIRDLRKKMAINNIKKSPFIGNGLGVVNDQKGEHIEYFYLDLLSKMGIIGTIAFFMPFIMAVYDLIKYRRKGFDEEATLLFASIINVVFLLVISYFNPCMNTNVGLSMYCLSMCIASMLKDMALKTTE